MEKDDNGAPNSKSLPVQSTVSGKEHGVITRRTSAMLRQSSGGISPWTMSSGHALPEASEGRYPPFRISAPSVKRSPQLIITPVVQTFEEVSYFQDAQPQLTKDDDDTCFVDIKSAISPHTPDGTSLLVATPTTEAKYEGNAAPNNSTAKRRSAPLSDEEKKRRNREYSKRHRMKYIKAKSKQEQYIAELESQCSTLREQVEAGKTRILELEEQVERMSDKAAKCAMLEEQVKNLEETNRRLLMEQGIKPAAPATGSPAVNDHPTSTEEAGTNLDPFDCLTPHASVTTQGFGFFERR